MISKSNQILNNHRKVQKDQRKERDHELRVRKPSPEIAISKKTIFKL